MSKDKESFYSAFYDRFALVGRIVRQLPARINISLLAVLLLAAALRLQDVNQPYVSNYAWREADTASIADAFAEGNWNIFLPQVRWGGAGPNYIGAEFQTVSYIAAIGYQAFGRYAWVGRAVSIAFGLWGIFALYGLACRVWDRPRALAGAAVMGVLPGSVFIERSFLPDGAMTALMTTSLWMLVTYAQTERHRFLIAAALSGMLGCLTKLPGAIVIIPAIYAVVALFGRRIYEPSILRSLTSATLLACVPVIAYYLWAWHVALSNPPYYFTGTGKFLWDSGLSSWLERGFFFPSLWKLIGSRDHLWSYPFIALAVIGIIIPLGKLKISNGARLFHVWAIAMIVRYIIEASHLVGDPYNLHLFNAVVAAFAGRALVFLRDSLHRSGITPLRAVPVVVFAASAVYAQVKSHHLFSDSYRAHYIVGRAIGEMSQASELVISLGLEPVVLYHSQRNGWVFPPAEFWPAAPGSRKAAWDYGQSDLQLLHALREEGGKWLAIVSWNDYTGGSGREYLSTHYPTLYDGILDTFEIVREMPEGLILRAK